MIRGSFALPQKCFKCIINISQAYGRKDRKLQYGVEFLSFHFAFDFARKSVYNIIIYTFWRFSLFLPLYFFPLPPQSRTRSLSILHFSPFSLCHSLLFSFSLSLTLSIHLYVRNIKCEHFVSCCFVVVRKRTGGGGAKKIIRASVKARAFRGSAVAAAARAQYRFPRRGEPLIRNAIAERQPISATG